MDRRELLPTFAGFSPASSDRHMDVGHRIAAPAS